SGIHGAGPRRPRVPPGRERDQAIPPGVGVPRPAYGVGRARRGRAVMSGCASPRDGHEASPRRGWDVPADGYLRWVKIDHGALAHNVKALKRYIAPAQLWPVVKGRAYGHGAVEAARTFLQAGADGLAVSA